MFKDNNNLFASIFGPPPPPPPPPPKKQPPNPGLPKSFFAPVDNSAKAVDQIKGKGDMATSSSRVEYEVKNPEKDCKFELDGDVFDFTALRLPEG